MVMLRLKCENFTSISFLGFKDRCQYLKVMYPTNANYNKNGEKSQWEKLNGILELIL